MPYVILAIGGVLVATSLLGTHNDLRKNLAEDVFGSSGYIAWVIAILLIGAIGYVKQLQPLSIGFLTLVLVALVLNNKGAFDNLTQAVNSLKLGT